MGVIPVKEGGPGPGGMCSIGGLARLDNELLCKALFTI